MYDHVRSPEKLKRNVDFFERYGFHQYFGFNFIQNLYIGFQDNNVKTLLSLCMEPIKSIKVEKLVLKSLMKEAGLILCFEINFFIFQPQSCEAKLKIQEKYPNNEGKWFLKEKLLK